MTPELKALYSKLTRLQKDIVGGVLDGMTYEQAYKDAGRIAASPASARSTVSEILANPNVRAYMDAVDEASITSTVMSKREALEGLSTIARTKISDLVEFRTAEIETPEGPVKQSVWSLKDDVDLNSDQMALISELTAGKDGFKFKTHSPLHAKKQLGDLLGWNAPTKIAETDTKGDDVDVSERDVLRRIAFLLAKGVQDSEQKDD